MAGIFTFLVLCVLLLLATIRTFDRCLGRTPASPGHVFQLNWSNPWVEARDGVF
jgi:hypothetical protein